MLKSENLVPCPTGAYVFIILLDGHLLFTVKKSCALDGRETEILLLFVGVFLGLFLDSRILRLKMRMVKV